MFTLCGLEIFGASRSRFQCPRSSSLPHAKPHDRVSLKSANGFTFLLSPRSPHSLAHSKLPTLSYEKCVRDVGDLRGHIKDYKTELPDKYSELHGYLQALLGL